MTILKKLHTINLNRIEESWASDEFNVHDEESGFQRKSNSEQYTEKVLQHMTRHVSGDQKAGIMLTGAPGLGKTNFVSDFATLIGVPYIVIEVPHIVEEHLINIPFIVADPVSSNKTSKVDQSFGNSNTSKLVLADSVLWSELQRKMSHNVNDAEYLKYMYSKTPQHIRRLFEIGRAHV